MRFTKQQIKSANTLRDRINEKGIESLKKSDLRAAVLHVAYLFQCGERIAAVGWHKSYYQRFRERFGVSMPVLGADLRSFSSALNGAKGGRPSLRPSYCSALERKTCKGCPLAECSSEDCHGNPIVGRWGKGA
jgi:hypothetical protein